MGQKKIILAGVSNEWKRAFAGVLEQRKSSTGEAVVTDGTIEAATAEDCVLLFGDLKNEDDFSQMLKELELLAQKPVSSAVLVSDDRVYGKLFGTQIRQKEEELGYVCHMADGDAVAARMRTVEHLAYRLAGEGVPIRIVRLEHDAQKSTDREAVNACADDVLKVLSYGKNGEVYNIPSHRTETLPETSPLSPMHIEMDGSKTENLKENR